MLRNSEINGHRDATMIPITYRHGLRVSEPPPWPILIAGRMSRGRPTATRNVANQRTISPRATAWPPSIPAFHYPQSWRAQRVSDYIFSLSRDRRGAWRPPSPRQRIGIDLAPTSESLRIREER